MIPAPNPAMDPIWAAMLCYHVYGFSDAILPPNWTEVPIDRTFLPNFDDITLEMDLTVFTGFGAVIANPKNQTSANLSLGQCIFLGPKAKLYCCTENGKVTMYAYTTRGSLSPEDWVNNGLQLVGSSPHFVLDSFISQQLSSRCTELNVPLVFLGHSKAGGHASLSSFVTGRPAVTFNASGLSTATKESILTHLKLPRFCGDGSNIVCYCNFFDPLLPGRARSKNGLLQPPDGQVFVILNNEELEQAESLLTLEDIPLEEEIEAGTLAAMQEWWKGLVDSATIKATGFNSSIASMTIQGWWASMTAVATTAMGLGATNDNNDKSTPGTDTPGAWFSGIWGTSPSTDAQPTPKSDTSLAFNTYISMQDWYSYYVTANKSDNTLTATPSAKSLEKSPPESWLSSVWGSSGDGTSQTISPAEGLPPEPPSPVMEWFNSVTGSMGSAMGGVSNAAKMAKLTWDSHMLPHMIAKLQVFKDKPHIICEFQGVEGDDAGESFSTFLTNSSKTLALAKAHLKATDHRAVHTYVIKRH